jgi:hypothetical protein
LGEVTKRPELQRDGDFFHGDETGIFAGQNNTITSLGAWRSFLKDRLFDHATVGMRCAHECVDPAAITRRL